MATMPQEEPNQQPAARAIELRKVFGEGPAAVEALRGITRNLEAGRFTAIMGTLHCMAGLDRPTSGTVFIGEST